MNNVFRTDDFETKFNELNERNQKYIIAIQQALMYAQESEEMVKSRKELNEKTSKEEKQYI